MAPGSSDNSEHSGRHIPLDDSLYKPPDVTLIDRQQWGYLCKRYRLSLKEVEVAELVCHGLKNMEIACQLRIKQGTVRTHLKSLFIKTRTQSKITLLLQLVNDALTISGESVRDGQIPIFDYDKPTSKDADRDRMPERDKW